MVLHLLEHVRTLLLEKLAEGIIILKLDPVLGHEEIVVEHG
jgi:hypothetical protein